MSSSSELISAHYFTAWELQGQFFEPLAQLIAQVGPFQREFHGSFQEAQLVAGVVAFAFKSRSRKSSPSSVVPSFRRSIAVRRLRPKGVFC